MNRKHCTLVVDRCPRCGAVLGWYEGESFCVDCDRWTLTEPIPALDDVDAMLLALAKLIREDREGGAA